MDAILTFGYKTPVWRLVSSGFQHSQWWSLCRGHSPTETALKVFLITALTNSFGPQILDLLRLAASLTSGARCS